MASRLPPPASRLPPPASGLSPIVYRLPPIPHKLSWVKDRRESATIVLMSGAAMVLSDLWRPLEEGATIMSREREEKTIRAMIAIYCRGPSSDARGIVS